MMNDFEKRLNKINDDIEKKELEIVQLELQIKYLKTLIKNLQKKKLVLLKSYRY